MDLFNNAFESSQPEVIDVGPVDQNAQVEFIENPVPDHPNDGINVEVIENPIPDPKPEV